MISKLLLLIIFLSWNPLGSLLTLSSPFTSLHHGLSLKLFPEASNQQSQPNVTNNHITTATTTTTTFSVRQVPGDGSCLFHSICSCVTFMRFRRHMKFDRKMYNLSTSLRHIAVNALVSNQTMCIENNDIIDGQSLLSMASDQYNLTKNEYCRIMLDPKTWGGGPEIIALSNFFHCPIHIYQLNSTFCPNTCKQQFCLSLFAKVGSPVFDNVPAMHLLCCDGRFPSIHPGQQKVPGDHFMALFPCEPSPPLLEPPGAVVVEAVCGATTIPYALPMLDAIPAFREAFAPRSSLRHTRWTRGFWKQSTQRKEGAES